MVRADLHVHSRYSAHPSEWFLQKIGTRESYTEPASIYKNAMLEDMDFVTVTDQNCFCASGGLQKSYPERAFTGVEVTNYSYQRAIVQTSLLQFRLQTLLVLTLV